MNEIAGKKAVLYGKIGEDYAIKKFKLFRSSRSHDALDVTGNLFSMSSIPVEIKSAQLFLDSGGRGQFIFTSENHEKLKKNKGYYIFVFMDKKQILFCLKILAAEIDKIKKNFFKNKDNNRKKNEFFRINSSFFKKIDYLIL